MKASATTLGYWSRCSRRRRKSTFTAWAPPTFNREDLERGFEPDSCFYVQNEALARGKPRIDLNVDPPPDLVIEIDITHPSLNKLPIYAKVKVSEVWRYEGAGFRMFALVNGEYDEARESACLPPLTSDAPFEMIEKSKSLELTAWMREVREWARQRPA